MLIARHTISLLSLSGNQQWPALPPETSAYDSKPGRAARHQTLTPPVAVTKHSDWQFMRSTYQ
jgi:hypothetical protein